MKLLKRPCGETDISLASGNIIYTGPYHDSWETYMYPDIALHISNYYINIIPRVISVFSLLQYYELSHTQICQKYVHAISLIT